MIANAFIPILLMIILADVYLELRFLRRQRWWKHLLWWIPSVIMTVYTIYLALQPGFIPRDPSIVNVYLFLLGLLVIPKAIFSLCSLVGLLCGKLIGHWRGKKQAAGSAKSKNYGEPIGVALALFGLYVLFYGTFIGFGKLEVKHVEVAFDDLPPAFDGYRILQFSDLHIGTYTGSRQDILQRVIDSINAQKADVIVFTGDIQNVWPEEITPHIPLLKTLQAKDGIYSVLGNHDYPFYQNTDEVSKSINLERTVGQQLDMDWTVLSNNRRYIYRGQDSIVMSGMANDGEGRFPQKGNINSALWRVTRDQFIVMLEHDPTAWRRKILPHCHAQLTLSGHTHALQFSLFGWSPAAFHYREYDGLYKKGRRYLYVSKGVGGIIPFRFGATGEIVVITLRKSKAEN